MLTTNNDPNVVLVSYLLAVLQNNGIARCALFVMHASFLVGIIMYIDASFAILQDVPV